MFNLLTDNLKKKIISEYRLRFFTFISGAIIFIQIVSVLFLVPSWLWLHYAYLDLELQTKQLKSENGGNNTKAMLTEISSTNAVLKNVGSILSSPSIEPLFARIISQKSSSVHINQLSYAATGLSASSTITISGIADSRDPLVNFSKSLKSSGLFTSVDLPISNLAKDNNIPFTILLTVRS